MTLVGKIDGDGAITVDHSVEIADVARSHDKVDPRRAFENSFAFLLCEAAGHTDFHLAAFVLQKTKLAEAGEDFLLGLVANRAGVEEDDVRFFLIIDAAISAQLETAAQSLAVEIVHLTAPSFDEEGFHLEASAANASRASANSLRASPS